MEMTHAESNLHFLQMHLISHFRHHVYQFGNIPMYSTEYWELAHKEEINTVWRHSNRIDAAWQILGSCGRLDAIQMWLLNLEFLSRGGADLPTEVVEHVEKTRPAPAPPDHHRILKGLRDNIHNVNDFGSTCDISLERIWKELIRYSQLSLPCECRLPGNLAILRTLPVELRTQLKILVLVFQELSIYHIHRAWWMGSQLFRSQTSRNDCVWIQAGGEHIYSAHRGRLLARLIALCKISWGYMQ